MIEKCDQEVIGERHQGSTAVKGKKIMVTGGAGFIGSNLLPMLVELGYQITVFDNFSTGSYESIKALPINFIHGNILDSDLINQIVADHVGVVHLAAQTGVPSSLADPRWDCELNVIGTLNLLEACRITKHRPCFIFACF